MQHPLPSTVVPARSLRTTSLAALALGGVLALPASAAPQAFGPARVISTAGTGAVYVEVNDVDGDGTKDLLVRFSSSLLVGQYRNLDGLGNFGALEPVTVGTSVPVDLTAVDLDGDEDVDPLFATSFVDNLLSWQRNDGSGSYGPVLNVPPGISQGFEEVGHGDFDADGDVDVLAYNGQRAVWYPNEDGLGTFGLGNWLPGQLWFGGNVLGVDLDRDGDRDILLRGQPGPVDPLATNWWYENDGLGGFGAAVPLTPDPNFGNRDVPADLNGDGRIDLVYIRALAAELAWLPHVDGQGLFGPEEVLATEMDGIYEVEPVDRDGDGDLDLVTVLNGTDQLAWHENLGNGTFAAPVKFAAPVDPRGLDARDLDSDGDRDLVLACFGSDTVVWYENLCPGHVFPTQVSRVGTPANPDVLQVGVTTWPAINKTWDPIIDHTSFVPGAVQDVLGVGPAPANVPFPPFGTILVDVFTAAPFQFTTTPGSSFSVAIPNQCSLIGLPLSAQGLSTDGATFALTNALDITIGTNDVAP